MNLTPDHSRVAVYHNENYYLSKYLGDKSLDFANNIHWFLEWGGGELLEDLGISEEELQEAQEEGSDEFYEMCKRIEAAMTDRTKESLVAFITKVSPTEAPSWSHMDLRVSRLPRNTWLVHFTDEAYQISEKGFKFGVSDMDQLALTTWLHQNTKKYGGYNFAFVAGNRESINAASKKGYGKHAVMFQSSGLEVYHYGDEEHQVIFWGQAIDPKSIVELASDGSEWFVAPRQKSSMYKKDREYVYKGSFKDVVNWVENHHFQYRKQIMGK